LKAHPIFSVVHPGNESPCMFNFQGKFKDLFKEYISKLKMKTNDHLNVGLSSKSNEFGQACLKKLGIN
jgi:hypothetical protein